jgi:TonB-linked SusC/RagA family outer membrane protein
MKITVLLILLTLYQVSASVYSQNTKLSFTMKGASIEEVFDEIKENTEFKFLYRSDLFNDAPEIDVNVSEANIDEVLEKVIESNGYTYEIDDKTVVIKKATPKPATNNLPQQQKKSVSGKVTDESGASLPGVSIIVKGTTTGVVTDIDGNYNLDIHLDAEILVFSFVGMTSQEIAVSNQSTINVTLISAIAEIDDVVVTALGISREKKSLGYSIEEVSGEDLNNTPQENILNSLSGKVAGVTISQMDGLIGSSVNMTIRGTTSLNTDNQPLFVIDGVPVANNLNNFYDGADMGNAISDINTNDIESVSVLKGPSAAALYGSRAGNGVVLITTKSGSSSKKGIGVDFSSAITLDIPYNYIDYQTEFGPGKAGVHMFEESENESWGSRLDAGEDWVQWNTDGVAAPLISYDNRLTDFYQTGTTYTNNVSVNGNNKDGNFRLSLGDMRNTGVVPNTNLDRKSISLNASYNLSPKLKVQGSMSVTESGSDNRPVVDGGRNTVVRSVYEMSAHVNILDLKDYWEPGMENIQQTKYKHKQNNPWFLVNENTISFLRDRTVSKIQFDWEIAKDLTLTGRYSRDSFSEGREAKKAFSTYGQWDGGYHVSSLYRKEANIDIMLSYNKTINNEWNISTLVGGNNMYMYGRSMSNVASSLVVPDLYTISNGVPGTVAYSSSWYEKTIYGIYSMASLGYKNSVYLDLTARNDWSNTLPEENNSYFYPSASLSVILSEMISLPEYISFAKVRAGVAQVGNDVGPYQLQQYYSTAEDWGSAKRMSMGGTLKNTSLKPEIATSKEIGADINFLNNRLGFEATVYTVKNENQVLNIGLPVESGATSKQINAGLIQSSGIELGLKSTPIQTKDFRWDMNFSLSKNRTKIKELANGIEYFHFGKEGDALVRTYVGETIGDIYARPVLTVKDETSPYNGYPLISSGGILQKDNNPENLVKIGNFNNDFIMGIQPHLKYKSVSLYANFDWRQGGEFFSGTMRFFRNNGQLDYNTFSGTPYDSNRSIEEQIKEDPEKFMGYWVGGRTGELGGFSWPDSPERDQDASFHPGVREVIDGEGNKTYVENMGGPETVWLTPFTANKKSAREFAEFNMYSATYVKLRELSLTYSLPTTLVSKLNMQDVSLSVIAKNIFEWTEAGIDFDPERAFKGGSSWVQGIEYYNALPWIGSLGLKLNVKF